MDAGNSRSTLEARETGERGGLLLPDFADPGPRKLKEKSIKSRLKWFTDKYKIIPRNRAGFRTGYTTLDHVVWLKNIVSTTLSQGKITSAVVLDLKRAYDVTWLIGLIKAINSD